MSRRSILGWGGGGEHWTNVPFSNFCLRFRHSVPTLNTDQVKPFRTQTKYWQYIIMFYAGARENIIFPVIKAYTVNQSTMPKRTHVICLYKSKIEYNWSLKCTHSCKRKTSNITTGKFCFVITPGANHTQFRCALGSRVGTGASVRPDHASLNTHSHTFVT